MKCFIVTLLALVLAAITVSADLDPKRVHVVDYLPNSRAFLFRGNEPVTKQSDGKYTFAYEQLYSLMKQRATEEANATFPSSPEKVYMVDLDLQTIFEHGQEAEHAFWADKSNAAKGKFYNWVFVGDVVWPNWLSPHEQKKMIENGTVWDIDRLPSRLEQARAMLLAGPPAGYDAIALYVHCAAGCDRTGEFCTSYELSYSYRPTLLAQYQRDCSQKFGCGRCPSFFSTGAIAWYCLTWNMFNASSSQPALPDCLTAYKCKLFSSHCVPSSDPNPPLH